MLDVFHTIVSGTAYRNVVQLCKTKTSTTIQSQDRSFWLLSIQRLSERDRCLSDKAAQCTLSFQKFALTAHVTNILYLLQSETLQSIVSKFVFLNLRIFPSLVVYHECIKLVSTNVPSCGVMHLH